MDKKDWELIIAVYEEKNITRAATRLFMAQPTVTYRLKQIEKEMQIEIIHRGRRGVEFTEEGTLLVRYAKEMVSNYQSLHETISNLNHNPQGTLRLGVAKAVALHTLPKLLEAFHTRCPSVTFEIDTGLNLDVIQDVYKENYHIGIVRGEHHWSDQKIELFEENVTLISIDPIELKDLSVKPQIVYKTDPALNMIIDSWWRENFKKTPNIIMKVSNMEVAKKMVLRGLGFAIVPSIILNDSDPFYKLDLYNKKGEPLLWKTWLLYKNDFLKLSMVREFIEFIETKKK